MPVLRTCKNCGRTNRVVAERMAETARCGACKAPLPPLNEPLEVDGQLFDEIVDRSRVPVMVDFWAAWCGPCRMAAPEVAQAAANMAGRAIVLKVDTDKHPEPAARFNVRSIPNFIVFAGGKVRRQQPGVVGHEQMEAWLREAGSELPS